MMRKKVLLKIASTVLLWGAAVMPAQAFSPSYYASTSKLASGKWVKIAIPETGVYELTPEQLSEMGFSSPQNVRVYGMGGHQISEIMDGSYPDDLIPVPVSRYNGKICFYACGPERIYEKDPRKPTARYIRTINPYSTHGYYFLTEDGSPERLIQPASTSGTVGTASRSVSHNFFYHENDMVSMSHSGQEFMGENLLANNTLSYRLPGVCPDSALVVNVRAAAKLSRDDGQPPLYITAWVRQGAAIDTVDFPLSQCKIYKPSSAFVSYNVAMPAALVRPSRHSETGELSIGYNMASGNLLRYYLDYFTINYWHKNELPEGVSQIRMDINELTDTDRIELTNTNNGNLVLWNIDSPSEPKRYEYAPYTDEQGHSTACFTPGVYNRWLHLVAFDPTATLKRISSWQPVENQNIHGAPTPNLVILTNKQFAGQAMRVAKVHEQEGLSVLVVDQEAVFNEFSSGTPDAMGIRFMNKMFYDRDKSKFKYFLVLGCGSYDNRGIVSLKENRVITYQSKVSNDEDCSYASDDFFGILDDNSGYEPASELVRLGIGRIPSQDLSEAKSDVNKLLNYIQNPDYGFWRNNVTVWADQFELDKGVHVFQAEGIANIIKDDLTTQLNIDKAYISMFPKASEIAEKGVDDKNKTPVEACQHVENMLSEGQFFGTYVGHADVTKFGKGSKLWTSALATSFSYGHFPIFSAACCDAAHYDGDDRGIGELMFHKPDGGVIAMYTTNRSTYSDPNDRVNRAFVNNLFPLKATGKHSRLGDAYMLGKQQCFNNTTSFDRMKYVLLGDPAMKVNYPKPFFKITTVNGTAVGEGVKVNAFPMKEVTVTAQVMNADMKTVNTNFNGPATLSIYDAERLYKEMTYRPSWATGPVDRKIYYPRMLLCRVEGRVVNGMFTGKAIVPRYIQSAWELAMVRVYAHNEGTDEMVNGEFGGLFLNPYEHAGSIADSEAPVIGSMFFNDETQFAESAVVPSNSMLYVTASDNVSINCQTVALGSSMSLQLDGGRTTYSNLKSYASLTNEGKDLSIAFPVSGLSCGRHTITFTVYDAAGNHASRTISFQVGPASKVTLGVDETPASEKATFTIERSEFKVNPAITLKVTDATGKIVWSKSTDTFPLTWNLKDNKGKRVPPGIYRYFGTYDAGIDYGGTVINHLIVIDPHKSNQ